MNLNWGRSQTFTFTTSFLAILQLKSGITRERSTIIIILGMVGNLDMISARLIAAVGHGGRSRYKDLPWLPVSKTNNHALIGKILILTFPGSMVMRIPFSSSAV